MSYSRKRKAASEPHPDEPATKKKLFPNRLVISLGILGAVVMAIGITLIVISFLFPPLIFVLAPLLVPAGIVLLAAGFFALRTAIRSALKNRQFQRDSKEEEKKSNSYSGIQQELQKEKILTSPVTKRKPDPIIEPKELQGDIDEICIQTDNLELLQKRIAEDPRLLNKRYFFDDTLLHKAIQYQKPRIVEFLLNQGIDKNALGGFNRSAIEMAADLIPDNSTKIDLINILLRHQVDIRTSLHRAANHANLDAVKILINANADRNALNDRQLTPLHSLIHAANNQNIETIKAMIPLLATKENINARGEHGSTPLHSAARYSSLEIIKTLIDHGADSTIRTNRNESLQDMLEERINQLKLSYSNPKEAVEILEYIKTLPQPTPVNNPPPPRP